ncbi:ankyrin repeat-containing domain protein [Hypomontagnella monticulosa]|nr:ankyrin repeat-containing domain protein [Hypomontagnella monticulosa]
MDPVTTLGAAAAAAQFVGTGIKAVSLAYGLYSKLRDVPETVRSQIAQLEALNKVAETVRGAPELQEDHNITLVLGRCITNVEALITLLERAKAAETSSRTEKAWKAVVGVKQETEMTTLLGNLEREKATLILSIETINSGLLTQLKTDMGDKNAKLASIQGQLDQMIFASNVNEERIFFAALFITDPQDDRAALVTAKGQRVEGTCTWITETDAYKSWLSSNSQGLWILGGPGKGKTMMSIYLTECLETISRQSRDTTVVYFFCDNRDIKRNSAVAILRGLVWQLARLKPELLYHGLTEFRLRGGKVETLFAGNAIETLWRIFKGMVQDPKAGSICCLIDGLDECDAASVDALAEKLSSLFSATNSSSHRLKLVILSRPLQSQHMSSLASLLRVRLDPDSDEEVSRDLHAFIEKRVQELSDDKGYSPALRQLVEKTFVERSGGTFLWVGFIVHDLMAKTASEVEESLHSLPTGLDGVYARILRQVKPQHLDKVRLLLHWVTMSYRPLTLAELGAAIGLESSETMSGTNSIRDHIGFCGHFLSVVGEKVNLVHQSAKDYLLRSQADPNQQLELFRVKAKATHLELANICLDYLQSGSLLEGPVDLAYLYWDTLKPAAEVSARLSRYPLLEYAVVYWVDHAKDSEELFKESVEKAMSLLSYNTEIKENWLSSYGYPRDAKEERRGYWTDLSEWEAIHFASYFGIGPVVSATLKHSGWKHLTGIRRAGMNQTPVHLAVLNKHIHILKLLLRKRRWLSTMPKNSRGLTPLHLAVKLDDEDSTMILLEAKASPNTQDTKGNTPLHDAVKFNNENMVRILLRGNAKPSIRNSLGRLPLHMAVSYAGDTNEKILEYLLVVGSNPNAGDDENDTALHYAAEGGKTAVCQTLLRMNASPNAVNDRRETPLHCAALNGEVGTIETLLRAGADPNARTVHQETPLIYAAARDRADAVTYLIGGGADINAQDEDGCTSLHIAVESGYRAVAKGLLRINADTSLKNNRGQTPKDVAYDRLQRMQGPISRRHGADRTLMFPKTYNLSNLF